MAAGCESDPNEIVPPKEALFQTDDCALIAAVGRQQYDLSRDDPPMSVKLNGEDAAWNPGCDWQGVGFNLVSVSGPEGEAATQGMGRLTFNRPRYDSKGALVRTSVTQAGQTTSALCRLERGASGWAVDSCGPDPKLTMPRPEAPNVADQTPDAKIPIPGDRVPTARDLTIPDPDPGRQPGAPQ